jgi:hypothetical protein
MRDASDPVERWKQAAEALGIEIPEQRLKLAAPVFDALWKVTRESLRRDLSLVEPDFQFRPDGR